MQTGQDQAESLRMPGLNARLGPLQEGSLQSPMPESTSLQIGVTRYDSGCKLPDIHDSVASLDKSVHKMPCRR